jgi:HK97 family phage portal protein
VPKQSLIGSLMPKRIRAQSPPVPLSPVSYRRGMMFNLGAGRADRESLLRAYGMSGTVFAIVSLLQQAAASPKWHLYKSQKQDGRQRYTTADHGTDQRVEVVQHAAVSLWKKPNDFHSGFEFREGANQHLELTGETVWVLDNETTTFPTSMWYVRPDRIEPIPSVDSFLAGWIYTGPNGESVPLDLDQVIMEKLPDPLDPYRGAGPVGSIMANIEQQNYATQYQRNLFLNGADPGAIIQVPNHLTDDEFDELVDRWRESHQGIARAGRVGVLEQGSTYAAPAGVNNKDMEYSNLRLANRDELREAWRMHKAMLGTVEDVNRANAQTGEEVFVGWQTIPRLDRRRDTLNCKFLPLFGQSGKGVEFDYEDPSPKNREEDNGELTTKTAAFAALIDAGVDPDAAADAVGLPSMPMVEKAVEVPSLPPGWVPAPPGEGGAPPAAPAARERIAIQGRLENNAAKKAIQQEAKDYPPEAIAWMYHATWTGPIEVPLNHIDSDMSAMDPADPAHVQDFVRDIENGDNFNPVILVKRPSYPLLLLVDGHHRYLACQIERLPVAAYIATVATDIGPWMSMHSQQQDSATQAIADAMLALLASTNGHTKAGV